MPSPVFRGIQTIGSVVVAHEKHRIRQEARRGLGVIGARGTGGKVEATRISIREIRPTQRQITNRDPPAVPQLMVKPSVLKDAMVASASTVPVSLMSVMHAVLTKRVRELLEPEAEPSSHAVAAAPIRVPSVHPRPKRAKVPFPTDVRSVIQKSTALG